MAKNSITIDYRRQVWDRQHSALSAPYYRLTCRGRGGVDGKKVNLGKGRGAEVSTLEEAIALYQNLRLGYTEQEIAGIFDKAKVNENGTRRMERFWTAEEVRGKIPSLERWNVQSYDIYITPIDFGFHYILFDDLTEKGVEYVRNNYTVCLIQTSSTNNFQAIVRVPRLNISELEQSAANILMRNLNHLEVGFGGDKSISAVRHPFRTCGFCNKKPGRDDFQTKIHYLAPAAVCARATAELETIRAELAQTAPTAAPKRQRKTKAETSFAAVSPVGATAVEKDFFFRWKRIFGLAEQKVAEGLWPGIDRSAIDYRVCLELIPIYGEETTAAALVRASPGIHTRHETNFDDYARRTVYRAAATLRARREAEEMYEV